MYTLYFFAEFFFIKLLKYLCVDILLHCFTYLYVSLNVYTWDFNLFLVYLVKN